MRLKSTIFCIVISPTNIPPVPWLTSISDPSNPTGRSLIRISTGTLLKYSSNKVTSEPKSSAKPGVGSVITRCSPHFTETHGAVVSTTVVSATAPLHGIEIIETAKVRSIAAMERRRVGRSFDGSRNDMSARLLVWAGTSGSVRAICLEGPRRMAAAITSRPDRCANPPSLAFATACRRCRVMSNEVREVPVHADGASSAHAGDPHSDSSRQHLPPSHRPATSLLVHRGVHTSGMPSVLSTHRLSWAVLPAASA